MLQRSPVNKASMGQDSWNLQYGKSHAAKYRKGTEVNMHNDEGYPGSYKNSKTKVIGLKANGNPKNFGPENGKKGTKAALEKGVFAEKLPKKRK